MSQDSLHLWIIMNVGLDISTGYKDWGIYFRIGDAFLQSPKLSNLILIVNPFPQFLLYILGGGLRFELPKE